MNKVYQVFIKPKNLIMFFVVLFIFADIVCENFLGTIYNKQSQEKEFYLFLSFMLMQIIFAPVQSGLSDLYGRKKSLLVSMGFSFLSLIFVSIFNVAAGYFSLLIFATISKGVIGNTLPIALAVIADSQDKNYRLSFAFSSAAYAMAYLALVLCVDAVSDIEVNWFLIALFVLILVICIKFFKDLQDRPNEEVQKKESGSLGFVFKNEAKLLVKDLKHIPTSKALTAFFLWELSLYSILLSQVDFQINKATHIAQWMMCGYLVGVLILGFCRKMRDKSIIKIGYYISFFSLVPYFLLFKLIEDENSILRVCYFFHSLGNAFLSPALMSILAKERKAHEQGRIYGLTDSVDTFGYLCATLAIMLYNVLKMDLIYLISFSFITFAFSWIFYSRFQTTTD